MSLLQRVVLGFVLVFLTIPSSAQQIGSGNADAEKISLRSSPVQSAYEFLVKRAASIKNPVLRRETLDIIRNPRTCILHRARLTPADKQRIVHELMAAGLADGNDANLEAGVFPPVLDDGSDCPHLPQPFRAAPGSSFGGHHSYPGGLAMHEAFNERAAIGEAEAYRKTYAQASLIDHDLVIAAPLWHDWAKTIVFQWKADGTEFVETEFGGNGTTDNNGSGGNSRTGAHHILGLAEAMKRGLDAGFIITQASAHSAPTLGNEYKVVNWLRAAAIIAGIDPVEKNFLQRDPQGHFHLRGRDGSETSVRLEYTIHNLSDADFIFSGPAAQTADAVLRRLAPEFGFDPADVAAYNLRFRNPALSLGGAENLMMLDSRQGPDAVRGTLRKLRDAGAFR